MLAIRILAALATFFLLVAPASAAVPLQKREIKEHRATYALDVAYPRTGNAAIDAVIEPWARDMARDFVNEAKSSTGSPQPWAGELTYEVVRNDNAMLVVSFAWYSYMGGAHPNTTTQMFNFLLPDGAQVELAELFTAKGVARISDMSVAQLKRALAGPDSMSDIDWIKRGAGPNARNFESFELLPRQLHIVFDSYQVAAYAAGPQEARIPLAQLRDVKRPDPRAPAASFDCRLSRSDVERAICSSRDLARLDRHVAELYFDKLTWVAGERARAAVRADQRAWLSRRDALCRRAGTPLVACLMGAYQQRLKTLSAM